MGAASGHRLHTATRVVEDIVAVDAALDVSIGAFAFAISGALGTSANTEYGLRLEAHADRLETAQRSLRAAVADMATDGWSRARAHKIGMYLTRITRLAKRIVLMNHEYQTFSAGLDLFRALDDAGGAAAVRLAGECELYARALFSDATSTDSTAIAPQVRRCL